MHQQKQGDHRGAEEWPCCETTVSSDRGGDVRPDQGTVLRQRQDVLLMGWLEGCRENERSKASDSEVLARASGWRAEPGNQGSPWGLGEVAGSRALFRCGEWQVPIRYPSERSQQGILKPPYIPRCHRH